MRYKEFEPLKGAYAKFTLLDETGYYTEDSNGDEIWVPTSWLKVIFRHYPSGYWTIQYSHGGCGKGCFPVVEDEEELSEASAWTQIYFYRQTGYMRNGRRVEES